MAEMLRAAGWSMVPLYLCSVVGLAWTLHLLLRMRIEGMGRLGLLDEPTGDLGRLLEQARSEDSPLGRVMARTVEALLEHPRRAEEIATRTALFELDRWEGGLQVFSLLARIAPLFGLLGTVLGMVELFGAMETGGSGVDASLLAGGIWKALLTTVAGLLIAIPALAMHAWLQRRIDRLRLVLEQGAGRVLDAAR